MPQKLSCPVPKDQRPNNEYMKLVQSDFYNWPILTESLFKRKIINLFFLFFIIGLPFSNLFINFNTSIIKLFLVNSAVSSFLVIFVISQLFQLFNQAGHRFGKSGQRGPQSLVRRADAHR